MDDEALEDNVKDDDQPLFCGDDSQSDIATFEFTGNTLRIVPCFKGYHIVENLPETTANSPGDE